MSKVGLEVSPYTELFRTLVRDAHAASASDIHIEPHKDGIDIRFRVFGDMLPPWKRLESQHKQSFTLAVKKETKLAIGVSGRPQDSRCQVSGVPVDLRVNLLPTLYGEKIVLRLLDSNREFGIDQLGIPHDTLTEIMKSLEYRNGVVLMSGPTGSGKTTTLYSMLCSIDRTKKNIVTLEDPVEYTIPGINQVKIDPKISFGNALRAILRQDPDVILVGEIRDEETAKLAFKAAATGHLVLSTVHANGASEVIGRLLGLGIDKDTIAENLRFSAAQRLVGRLCQFCSLSAPDIVRDGNFKRRFEPGCTECRSGITGRLPVIEFMDDLNIKDLVLSRNQTGGVKESLKVAALKLAKNGLIDIKEVTQFG